MKKSARKLVHHFGGKRLTADALAIHEETLRLWLRDGIPLARAIEIERRTAGVVRAEDILREARR